MLQKCIDFLSSIPPMRLVLVVLSGAYVFQSLESYIYSSELEAPAKPVDLKESFEQLQYRQRQGYIYIGATVVFFGLYMMVRQINVRAEQQDEIDEACNENSESDSDNEVSI
jgi:Na+/H+ antiporter NhaC